MPTRVLLVEDDARVSAFIRRGLEAEGYAVDAAADALHLQRVRTAQLAVRRERQGRAVAAGRGRGETRAQADGRSGDAKGHVARETARAA